MNKNVIVVPTYNEMGNIEITLKKIENLKYNFDVVVVDDNSPDGTGDFVQKAISNKTYEYNLILIRRDGKNGLGTAYIESFKKCLELNKSDLCHGNHNCTNIR